LLVQKESFVFETPVATRVGPRIQTFKSMTATAFTSLFGMFYRFHHQQSEKRLKGSGFQDHQDDRLSVFHRAMRTLLLLLLVSAQIKHAEQGATG
jgi:hypothetical protein